MNSAHCGHSLVMIGISDAAPRVLTSSDPTPIVSRAPAGASEMPRYWSVDEAWTAAESSPEFDRELRRSLGDEIAIDFPSMRGPISRMRAAFGDAVDEAPMVARVTLSARQAHAGTRVPLDLPLRRLCDQCGGRGGTWRIACAPCHGTGYATESYPLTVTVPAGVSDGARFAFSVAHPRGLRAQVEVRVAVL